jgi:hypothetical protein
LLYEGYIVTFTKVLTICHSWIHPLHHSPLSPSHHFWNSFSRSHFSIFIHEYIVFPLYSPSYTFSLWKDITGSRFPTDFAHFSSCPSGFSPAHSEMVQFWGHSIFEHFLFLP